jgi:hypothetical protein
LHEPPKRLVPKSWYPAHGLVPDKTNLVPLPAKSIIPLAASQVIRQRSPECTTALLTIGLTPISYCDSKVTEKSRATKAIIRTSLRLQRLAAENLSGCTA